MAQKMSADPYGEMLEVFDVIDHNSDGKISTEELRDMLRRLGEHVSMVTN